MKGLLGLIAMLCIPLITSLLQYATLGMFVFVAILFILYAIKHPIKTRDRLKEWGMELWEMVRPAARVILNVLIECFWIKKAPSKTKVSDLGE